MSASLPAAPPVLGTSLAAPPLLLYSTNTLLKYKLAKMHCGGRHYVWCSPVFSSEKVGRYMIGAGQPPSSDPASIYAALSRAVECSDGGDAKIVSQRTTLSALAVEWHAQGRISEDTRDDIIAIVGNATFADWKPLIFVIPYGPVAARTKLVPRLKRAGTDPEYIIEDLAESEFDIIELKK